MLGAPEESPHKWQVALVDDDSSTLRATARLLTIEGYDVSAYPSSAEFLASLRVAQPDVLLVDLRMPDVNGLELQAAVLDRSLRIPMVFMSAYASVAASVQALRGGAIDFLEKPCDRETLVDALERAIASAVRERRTTSMITDLLHNWHTLTAREQEVCRWVVKGRLNKQIAAAIGTGEKTVKVHRARAMTKMRADSVATLVRMVDAIDEHVGESVMADQRQRAG
ncbi:MAG: DNA-binding response regulator [Gemmatimonadetes bacterium]|nr:MAG: DNA-binding response regulator [Gemmatimonadota bacterium]